MKKIDFSLDRAEAKFSSINPKHSSVSLPFSKIQCLGLLPQEMLTTQTVTKPC